MFGEDHENYEVYDQLSVLIDIYRKQELIVELPDNVLVSNVKLLQYDTQFSNNAKLTNIIKEFSETEILIDRDRRLLEKAYLVTQLDYLLGTDGKILKEINYGKLF